MADYDNELLAAARRLISRRPGQRGKLSSARIRRSVSTTYYALFHFLLDEVGKKVAGAGNATRVRRRMLVRSVTHKGARTALSKVKGPAIEASVIDFFGSATPPVFISDFARAFSDAQTKRLDADYDLNKPLSEGDARVLQLRAKRVIRSWRDANSAADRDFKRSLCLFILLNGKLKTEEA